MTCLEKNLAALRTHTPAAAAPIAEAQIPEGFVPALGTDRAETFLRTTATHLEWLGQTSMPTASAAPLVASLEPGSNNGLALSIGTGHEWLAFLQRLSKSQALFVYEPEAALLKMALSVCDLSEPLASAKIVLLTGPAETAAIDLDNFLRTHLGHEPPSVLHPLATLAAERKHLLLASGEAIVRHAINTRAAHTNKLIVQLAELQTQHPTEPQAAILATARYATERPLHASLAAGTPILRLDHYASTSLARRVEFLLTHNPATIVSDFFRSEIGCVPPAIAVRTSVPPLMGPAIWQPNRLPVAATLQPADQVIVQAQVHKLLLEAHGFASSQVILRPQEMPQRISPQAVPGGGGRDHIALIADLPRTDAASLGLQLPTHQTVHAAAIECIAADYLDVTFHGAADILRRSLVKAGIASGHNDSALKDPMLRIIRDILIPSIPLLTLARALIDQQIPLRLIGDWPNLDRPTSAFVSLAPFPLGKSEWRNCAAVVHLSPWGVVPPLLLEAAAGGFPIVAPRHPSDSLPGSLATILPEGEKFLRPAPQQLFATLKSLLRKRQPQKP